MKQFIPPQRTVGSKRLINHFEERVLFLTLLFLPTQLGKHFWPPFSYVQGIRSDYLSPTLYVTDVLIALLFFLILLDKKALDKLLSGMRRYFREIIISTAVVASGIFLAKEPLLGLYGCVKLLEFLFLGWYVGTRFSAAKVWKTAGSAFAIGMIFESILAFLQYRMQASIGGWLYFLGERFFTSVTPGIANVSLNGHLLLRPYGTLPHPNVLAGYMLLGILIITTAMYYQKRFVVRLFFAVAIVAGAITIVLSLSRVAIVLLVIVSVTAIARRSFLSLIFVVLLSPFFLPLFFGRFSPLTLQDEAVVERVRGIHNAFSLLQKNVYFGVGINNYIPSTAVGAMHAGSLYAWLQPAHTMYLLIGSEVGVMGLGILAFFVYLLLKRLRSSKIQQKNVLFAMFLIMGIIGFFDHYFWTLQQGRMLLAVVFGLAYSRLHDV